MGRRAPELLLRQTKKELIALQKIIDTSLFKWDSTSGVQRTKKREELGAVARETKAVAIVATAIIS